jgi:hypothetical protein
MDNNIVIRYKTSECMSVKTHSYMLETGGGFSYSHIMSLLKYIHCEKPKGYFLHLNLDGVELAMLQTPAIQHSCYPCIITSATFRNIISPTKFLNVLKLAAYTSTHGH